MNRMALVLFAAGIAACSGSSFSSKGTGGSDNGTGGNEQGTGGYEQGTGGDISAGGTISSGGGTSVGGGISAGGAMGVDCEALWQEYMRSLAEARTCDATGTECTIDAMLFDRCGCQRMPVNVNKMDVAQQALNAFLATCDYNACGAACVGYNQVHCAADATGGYACTGG